MVPVIISALISTKQQNISTLASPADHSHTDARSKSPGVLLQLVTRHVDVDGDTAAAVAAAVVTTPCLIVPASALKMLGCSDARPRC